ncbi:MAG TPA: DUF5069 domain-containing protein [Verrucomicrobiae bacterium]|nr:DUF5069 domain-containing protein [Verrucomicrobiae bacterium]
MKAVAKLIATTEIENKTTLLKLCHYTHLTSQNSRRAARVRLGGYVILPRCLDKGRATLAGKNGEYHYACPLDQRFLEFVGINPEVLKKELGKSDGEILEWIEKNAEHKRSDAEIAAWSELAEKRVPTDVESREFFNGIHKAAGPKREDIATWFDVLDLDDYVTFGGKA